METDVRAVFLHSKNLMHTWAFFRRHLVIFIVVVVVHISNFITDIFPHFMLCHFVHLENCQKLLTLIISIVHIRFSSAVWNLSPDKKSCTQYSTFFRFFPSFANQKSWMAFHKNQSHSIFTLFSKGVSRALYLINVHWTQF